MNKQLSSGALGHDHAFAAGLSRCGPYPKQDQQHE
jgi:hypothetical protein